MAKGDAVLKGVMPHRGTWLIHRGRRRAYGPVWCVRRSGAVVWQSQRFPGLLVETSPDLLYDQGYEYSPEIPEGFEVLR